MPRRRDERDPCGDTQCDAPPLRMAPHEAPRRGDAQSRRADGERRHATYMLMRPTVIGSGAAARAPSSGTAGGRRRTRCARRRHSTGSRIAAGGDVANPIGVFQSVAGVRRVRATGFGHTEQRHASDPQLGMRFRILTGRTFSTRHSRLPRRALGGDVLDVQVDFFGRSSGGLQPDAWSRGQHDREPRFGRPCQHHRPVRPPPTISGIGCSATVTSADTGTAPMGSDACRYRSHKAAARPWCQPPGSTCAANHAAGGVTKRELDAIAPQRLSRVCVR